MSHEFSPLNPLRIGSRRSPLAVRQAEEVRERLMEAHGLPLEAFRIVTVSTAGDRHPDRPFHELGGKGAFTREIERDLLDGKIDIAAHSMKDMPFELPDGLAMDCCLKRGDARDALAPGGPGGILDLPEGAAIGTSSIRRRAQLLFRRPDLRIAPLRGNVQTRMAKVREGAAHAAILAAAGLQRLGIAASLYRAVEADELLPAVAQGIIAVERRADDASAAGLLRAIHHGETGAAARAERAFMSRMEGSCQTPMAALAIVGDGQVTLRAEALMPGGEDCVSGMLAGPAGDAGKIGIEMAESLIGQASRGFFDWLPRPSG